MKKIFVYFILVVMLLISCQAPNSGHHGEGTDSVTELKIIADGIRTISPYSYSTGYATYSLASGRSGDGVSYLSYNTSEDAMFEPLVFETPNGTKVVFQDATITQIDENIYYVYIQNLETIRREPVVQYKDSGEDYPDGSPIMIADTVMMDIENSYGENYAFIDISKGTVSLVNKPEDAYTENSLRLVNGAPSPDSLMDSENYIYMLGSAYNEYDYQNLYRVKKDNVSNGNIEQLTIAPFSSGNIISITDNMALIHSTVSEIEYVLDLTEDIPPTAFIPGDYTFQTNNGSETRTLYLNYNNNQALNGNKIYYFDTELYYPENGSVQNMLDIMELNVESGVITPGKIQRYQLSTNQEIYGLRRAYSSTENGYTDVILIQYDTSAAWLPAGIIWVRIGNDTITVKNAALTTADKTATTFQVAGDRIYWIAGAGDNANGSQICWYDYSEGGITRINMDGKTATSSDFSVSEDGTVVYWQSLGRTEVGTFRWNPEREDTPTLLSLDKADVHSIVNINTL